MNTIDKKAGKEGSRSLIEKGEENPSSVPTKPNEQSKLPSSAIISPSTTTSPKSTIDSSNPNIFSVDNPYHKPFLASMIVVTIIIAIIFIGWIIKKIAVYKTTNSRNLLLDPSMVSNSSMSYESSSNYISRDPRPS